MDAISLHPYPNGLGDALLYKTFDDVRDMRELYGDRSKPLWATETGLTTTGSSAFTEGDQARTLVHVYRTLGSMPDVEAVLFHTLFEPPQEIEGSDGPGFGVVHANGVPKPAYCALAAERATAYNCPTSVVVPGADATQDANWSAQGRVHSALDASRSYYSAHATYAGFTNAVLHAMVPALSALAPPPGAKPGPGNDPTQIGIYYSSSSPSDITVCNASTGSYAYCIWQRRGSWIRYNRSSVSIAGAYQATRATGGLNW